MTSSIIFVPARFPFEASNRKTATKGKLSLYAPLSWRSSMYLSVQKLGNTHKNSSA